MNRKVTAFVVSYPTVSEVFLYRLFDGLARKGPVEIRAFNYTGSDEGRQFSVKSISKPRWAFFRLNFYRALAICIRKRERLGKSLTEWASDVWRLSVLLDVESKRIYFPFLAMTRQFCRVLSLVGDKQFFTSIRGTDITVTPLLREKVLEVYRTVYPCLSGVHYLSPHLKELANGFGLVHENEQVIVQGVDLAPSEEIGNPDVSGSLRLITVGRLHYIKGIQFAILAVRELRNRGVAVRLSVVGDGDQAEFLKYLVKRERLEQEVVFLGALTEMEVKGTLKDSHLMVHPHLVEGVSNTMLEAIASGIKVVTFESDIAQYGMASLCDSIVEVPNYDYREMAGKLEAMFHDQSWRVDRSSVSEICEAFSLEKHVGKFLEFFESGDI